MWYRGTIRELMRKIPQIALLLLFGFWLCQTGTEKVVMTGARVKEEPVFEARIRAHRAEKTEVETKTDEEPETEDAGGGIIMNAAIPHEKFYEVSLSQEDADGRESREELKKKLREEAFKQYFEETLIALLEKYPAGKYWNRGGVTNEPCNHKENGTGTCNHYRGASTAYFVLLENRPDSFSPKQCLGFASLLSDEMFGVDAPVATFEDFDDVRPGDQIRLRTVQHSCFVLEKGEDYVTVAECNADYQTCKIAWGRKITRNKLESTNAVYITRYKDIPQAATVWDITKFIYTE